MPELPEAETIARDLSARIGGKVIRRVRVHRDEVAEPLAPRVFRAKLTGRTVKSVERRAKWIAARLETGGRWVTQLRMTGRFTWGPPSPMRREPHLSLSLLFEGPNARDAGVLRFYDVRRFARMAILDTEAWAELDARLGPEPLSDRFTHRELAALLTASRAPVRNVLLDQRRIAGIGNIYANEACFIARIDPRRPGTTVAPPEAEQLHRAIQQVLTTALRRRGTSFSDYRDVGGVEGGFQNELAVYGRAGEPCSTCGTPLVRVVLAGRSAYYCPSCQS